MEWLARFLRDVTTRFGEQSWPLLVEHTRMRAFGMILAFALAIVVGILCGVAALCFKKLAQAPRKQNEYLGSRDGVWAGYICFLVACVLIIAGFSMGILSTIPDLLAPEGATIRMLIGR